MTGCWGTLIIGVSTLGIGWITCWIGWGGISTGCTIWGCTGCTGISWGTVNWATVVST